MSAEKTKVFGVVIAQNERQIKKQLIAGDFYIGKNSVNNLVLPDWDTVSHQLLFSNNPGSCTLHFNNEMSGEIKKGNSTISLDDLKEQGLAHKEDGGWTVAITGKTGWVQFKDLTFVFGYSDPAEVAVPAAKPIPKAFAPTARGEDKDNENTFFLVFAIVFALHAAFFIGAMLYIPKPVDPNSMFIIPEEPKTELAIREEVVSDASETPTDALNSGGGGGGGAKGKGAGPGSDFGSKGMLAIIGARGGVGSLADWGESGGANLDSLAGGFGGISLGTQGSAFGGKGGGGGFGGGDLGALLAGGGGGGPVTSGENLRRGGRVSASGPSGISGSGSGGSNRKSSDIYKVVSRITGSAKTKYETRLRSNPNLKGTISIRFTIGKDGGVTSSSISSNTTGDPSFGNEIMSLIRRLNFGPTDKGDTTVVYPFTFSKEQ